MDVKLKLERMPSVNNNVDLFSGCNNATDSIIIFQNFLKNGVNPSLPLTYKNFRFGLDVMTILQHF